MFREIYVFFVLILWVGANEITVTVKQGKLLGQREASIFDGKLYFAFYGVPYAQPPIERLRFSDPQAIQQWNGTYDARTAYYGTCAQKHIVHQDMLFGSEDCLYLNIYTPHIPQTEGSELNSVIVWIHGYAFGSSFSHIHGADFFINHNIILVTLTHRIGVFGFLNQNNGNANMGLKDIVMALKWIRANIKQFGGDKKRITLMGSGSGATFISLLMITEASKLFSKAILQSGAMLSPSVFQGDPASERRRLIQELKRKRVKLSNASTKDIITAAHDIYIRNNKEMENLQRPIIPFTPTIEPKSNTSLLEWTPTEFYDRVNGKHVYLNKPILLGYNSQESIMEMIPFIYNPYYTNTFIKNFKYMVPFSDGCSYNISSKTYKTISRAIKSKYFKTNSIEYLLKYASDLLKFPLLKFVKTYLSESNSKLYMYKFDYIGTLNANKATSLAEKNVRVNGAASGDEVCYILRCEPLLESYKLIDTEQGHKDKKFISDITHLWSNFANFGDPTPHYSNINFTWLPVNSKYENVLLIRKDFKLFNAKNEYEMFNFWNSLYENYYKQKNCEIKHDEL